MLCLSADDQTLLASGGKDNKIRIWNQEGVCLAIGDGHVGAVTSC